MTEPTILHSDPVNLLGLQFVSEPKQSCWQLRRPIDITAYTGLLDWRLDKLPVDSQVPVQVIELLTRALCCRSRATFFHLATTHQRTNDWIPCDGGFCRTLRGYKPVWLTRHPDYPLFSTTDAQQAQKCFHAEPFDWQMQQQLVFLSAKDAKPPDVDYATVHRAFSAKEYKNLARYGIDGLFYPGVDGDFAGFMVFDKAVWTRLLAELERQCKINGLQWALVTEHKINETIDSLA